MGIRQKGNYVVLKNNTIFFEDENIQSLNILLKGKVDVYLSSDHEFNYNEDKTLKKCFRIFTIDDNIFIGTIDLFLEKKYSFTYRTLEDSNFYAYPVNKLEKFIEILDSQIDLSSLTIMSLSSMLKHSYNALLGLEDWMKKIFLIANNLSIFYWYLKDKYNLIQVPSMEFIIEAEDKYNKYKENNSTTSLSLDFINQEILEFEDLKYTYLDEDTKNSIIYYEHIRALPLELKKNFFSADNYISRHHFIDIARGIDKIKFNIKESMLQCINYFNKIYNQNENCIFSELICLIREANKFDQNVEECFQVLDVLITKVNDMSTIFLDKYQYSLGVDFNKLLEGINQLKVTEESNVSSANSEFDGIPEELVDSFEKILRYSGISLEKADLLRSALDEFRDLKNKDASNEIRNVSRTITPIFFEIYEKVLKKVVSENNNSRLFEMFLTYGYMDEKLLTLEQVKTLYNLSDKNKSNGPCNVYNSYEWLTEIFNTKKDPSKNEFDEDYFDVFRGMLKKGKVSAKDKKSYSNDREGRLLFEINNMFKINHRVCSGQFRYFPILTSDNIISDLNRSFVTKERVNELINKILEIDFSAFHRETFYKNPRNTFEKELIFKFVAPDIILMPIFGSRGIMWQEITGRDRCKPGRIILPIFTSENLEDILIKMIGNFRWELCRTMMGVSWNDISTPSLTSEYSDYIQFYKKNKELSEDAKDRIKKQIKKNNNHMRDIFTSDYEIWIKNERNGNVRLNKVSRNILFKNCPFNKTIREKLVKQPIFSEMVTSFNTIRQKRAEVLERRYNKLVGAKLNEHPALLENLRFFKEM